MQRKRRPQHIQRNVSGLIAQLEVELAQNEVGNSEGQVMEGLLHHHTIKFGIQPVGNC